MSTVFFGFQIPLLQGYGFPKKLINGYSTTCHFFKHPVSLVRESNANFMGRMSVYRFFGHLCASFSSCVACPLSAGHTILRIPPPAGGEINNIACSGVLRVEVGATLSLTRPLPTI